MTHPRTSRSPKAAQYLAPEPVPGVTLASVLAAIAAADLPPRRKHDMASAIRTVARVLGAEPDQLPALPRLLARRLNEVAPLTFGIEAKRWNNIRALLRAALNLMAPVAPGRHLNGMTPIWQAFWDYMRMTGRTELKIGLSRFMRYCSAEGIAPADVTAEVYARFSASLDNSLLKDPANAARCTRYAWTKARSVVPGWPDFDLPKPSAREGRYSLPLSAFPESFQQDLEAWLRRLAGKDPKVRLRRRPQRPESLHQQAYYLRGFASALVEGGRDPATIHSLADLVQIGALEAGFGFYLDRNGGETNNAIMNRMAIMLSLARYWVAFDSKEARQAHVTEMLEMAETLHYEVSGLTERNLERLQQFDDSDNLNALLDLPQRLFARAETMRHGQRAAVLVQSAIAVALLTIAPMRMRNLTMIDIDEHLTRPGRGRNILVIAFKRSEVKNREYLSYPVPEDALVWLNRYLEEYRPLLAPPGSTALFPAKDGGPKGRAVLGPRISRTIFEHTGLKMNPHLFRHLAAKIQLDEEPGSYELVRRLLGHRDIRTTTLFYTGLESTSAARRYDENRRRVMGRRRKP